MSLRATNNGSVVIGGRGNKFIGINLGAEHCAEHEWGIDGIQRAFGIPHFGKQPFQKQPPLIGLPKPPFGIERRQITALPEMLTLTDQTVSTGGRRSNNLFFRCLRSSYRQDSRVEDLFPGLVEGGELGTAWCEDQFMIVMPKTDKADYLQELWDAFARKDIVIGTFGGNVFANSNLVIGIASRIPKSYAKHMYDVDIDHYNLLIAAEKTGIQAKLESAGKEYYALSPHWARDHKGVKTSYDVVFWLNPMDQDRYDAGYFTVENLEAWMANKGPIVSRAQRRR